MAGGTDSVAEGGSDAPVKQGDQTAAATYTPENIALLRTPEPIVPVKLSDATMKVDAAPLFRTEAQAGVTLNAGDVLPTSPKDKIPSKDAPPGSLMERLLKGDKTSPIDEKYQGIDKLNEMLKKYGLDGKVPGKETTYADTILQNLKDRPNLEGTPDQQLARITQALDAIINPAQAGMDSNEAFARLSPKDRENLVKDFVMRMADPEQFANQGAHNTCALNSLQKLALQGNDPARLAEQLAGVVNNGFTYVINPATGKEQKVEVHSASLRPDQESLLDPLQTRGNQTRSMAGQAIDALFGQMAADNQGKIDGKSYVYLAANAGDFTGGSRSQTGEGMFEADANGNPKSFVDDSPQMTLVAKAQLARMLGLPKGINFVHESMRNEVPPSMYDQFTFFDDATQLRQKLTSFLSENGLKAAEVRVNAPYLPGESMAGHGFHSVNIRMDNGLVRVDNHWGDGKDQTLSDAQIDTATDARRWGPMPSGVYRPGQPQTPGNIIDGPTRLNTLPTVNESPDDYRKRMEQIKADQEAKVKELENQKIKPDISADRLKEITNELLNTAMIKEAFTKAFNQFNEEMKAWSGDKSGSEPNLSNILNNEMVRVRLK